MQELSSKVKTRVNILAVVIYALVGILFIRLFYLQIIRGEDYLKQSLLNKTQIIKISAYRSVIYDRTKENKLAYNRKSLCVVVIPANLPEDPLQQENVLSNTSILLGMSVSNIKLKIQEEAFDKYTPVVLKYDIDPGVLVKFAEHIEKYPGLLWENRPRRVYPLMEKASQLIGYTGIISKQELAQLKGNPEYHFGSVLGKMGIEKMYDAQIRGKEGILERMVDAKGNVIEQSVQKEAIAGNPVVLTIHKDLQELAYQLLAARKGAVVASIPATGEILVLVSSPGFDPNIFTERFSESDYNVLKNNPDKPFLNRAIGGTYPPSSIFKLITASAALSFGIPLSKSVKCTGETKIGNRVFRCWNIHGTVNFKSAIAQSCDSFFYNVGLQIGRDLILEFARAYGINQKTKIDLPGETSGLIPEMDWFVKRYKRPWSQGDTANISIGQGDLLATPIGINVLTMAIVNNGLVYQPFVMKEILSFDKKEVIWSKQPVVLRKVNLNPKHFEFLQQAMREVCTSGTAGWVQNYLVADVPIAGKTGTGQAGGTKEDHAWFTAFAPYGHTKLEEMICVTVVVEHGGGGSAAAAPIAAQIIDYYYKQIMKIEITPKKEVQ
ncbi:MAG: penicillin-binding protein 2 [Spirochaetes bacterium GWF1_51_8]|nr:MAG: penicillin-binding protein 2 [Spirochaetes bacterium GWF1_51_8]